MRWLQPTLPARWSSGIIGVAVTLSGFYVAASPQFVATGQISAMIDTLGVHTNPIVALDPSMVVPVALFAAVRLWQRRS